MVAALKYELENNELLKLDYGVPVYEGPRPVV